MTDNKSATVRELRDAVEAIDCFSQDGFQEIAAIAKLAVASMGTAEGLMHTENILFALRAIWGTAETTVDLIADQAERVGCAHKSPPDRDYWKARAAIADARQGE
ncbi:MAG TPA: hypothetical protein PKA16_04250 [Ottowia sp.]|uniref:hypothetical protein n=1 Tax=Ottowia sp. TaxID=1898956 RepID=UPI002C75B5AB|nr:hypothetical protein [Ottowia sp.]HMN20587.1 hypothetical protein [Ottowia sp.]